jgi:hypothetical protein
VNAPAEDESQQGVWVRLAEISSEAEAQIIHGYLESAGVTCEIESLAFRAEPVTFGPLARVRVWVLRGQAAQARELLHRAQKEAQRAADEQALEAEEGGTSSTREP